MSTAVSTEIPTSALLSDGLSLIPSPIYPTTLPFSFNTLTILAFSIGESFAKIFTFFSTLPNALSESFSISLPKTILGELIPTFLHTLLVTSLLSPVKTITLIPASFSFFTDFAALSFGGSKNPINPN